MYDCIIIGAGHHGLICANYLANSGWKYDRYSELPSLDAKTEMTVADLKGPGIIRHIHITRHVPEVLASRGVVLEVWFDDAELPAVLCPLADFFGDGEGLLEIVDRLLHLPEGAVGAPQVA